MNRHLLLGALLATSSLSPCAASDVSFIWDVTDKNGAYSFELYFKPSEHPLKSNQTAYLELSKQKDFTFIDKALRFPIPDSGGYTTILLKPSDIPAGEYYYRASVYTNDNIKWGNSEVYASPTTMIETVTGTKATDAAAYSPLTDTNIYDAVTLSDDMTLNIESVWFRSGLNGLPLMPTTPPGLDPTDRTRLTGTLESYDNPPFDSFSHGAIVKNGVIYIGVGGSSSFNRLAKGNYAKPTINTIPDRVMLYRYDLSNGEFLNPVRVKNHEGKDFDQTHYRVMPWLRTDDAGTPYFLCPGLHASRGDLASYSPCPYTLDLSQIEENTSGFATLNAQYTSDLEEFYMSKDVTDFMFGTITGSIKDGNYKLWGMKYNTSAMSTTAESWTTDIKIWNVKNRLAENSKIMTIDANPFSSTQSMFSSYSQKIYPVDASHLYIHATPSLRYSNLDFNAYANYEPAYYEVDEAAKTATLKNKLSDAITDDMEIAPATETRRMSGFPIIKVGDMTFAAYGHLSDNPDATAVQLIYIKDPSLGFEPGNIVPLWDLFKGTGLSKSLFQALDMTFIPAEAWNNGARAASDNLIGHLLVYAAGAGMGLYRITADDDAVNAITQVDGDGSDAVRIQGNSIIISSPIEMLDIIDMQGRTIMRHSSPNCGTYPLPALAKGIYMLRTPSKSIKFAI